MASEYPSVDGPLTLHSYIGGLEQSYENYKAKAAKRAKAGKSATKANGVNGNHSTDSTITVDSFDYIGWHGPYGKLVQKATARLFYIDYLADPTAERFSHIPEEFKTMPRNKSVLNKDCEKLFIAASADKYKSAVWPATQCMRRLGNMYTASVYGGLASIVDSVAPEELQGKRIALFSFGSGLAASFFTIYVRGDTSSIRTTLNLKERLASMEVRPCQEFVDALKVS